jgi:hypothetical protein
MRPLASVFLFALGIAVASAQDDLPKRGPADTLDFEPKLMLDGPHAAAIPPPTPGPEDRLQQCQAALLQAEQRAVDSEQLFKEGILAKVEIEARYMRITEARKNLADATVAVAAEEAASEKKSFDAHQATQAQLDAAIAELKTAQAADAASSADWAKAQLDAATLDLWRKRKLFSEGVGSRHEVQEAEDRVALLSGTAAK